MASGETTRPYPAFALGNWKDQINTWSNTRDSMNAPPCRSPGFTSLRASWFNNYQANALSEESFAAIVTTPDGVAHSLTDPKLWAGDVMLDVDDSFDYVVQSYNGAAVPGQLAIDKQVLWSPDEDYVIYEYMIANESPDTPFVLSFLDYAVIPALDNDSRPSVAWASTPANQWSFKASFGAASTAALVAGPTSGESPLNSYLSFQVGPASGPASPLATFSATKKLSGNAQYTSQQPGQSVSYGVALSGLKVPPGANFRISLWRGLTPTSTAADALITRACGVSADQYHEIAEEAIDYFFSSSKLHQWISHWCNDDPSSPECALKDSQMVEFYEISLMAMKNSQNPTLGTFVASFHPAYQFKTWGRDAVFSAMIMMVAGYHSEASKMLEWLGTAAEQPIPGTFHTCYDWYTGANVGFVEPQYDSAGAALMAYYLYYTVSRDASVLEKSKTTIRAIEQFLSQTNGATGVEKGLIAPDYSIWEESSDGRTGQPIQPSHFTFTHSLAYAGVYAAAEIESLVFQDEQRAAALSQRAKDIQSAMEQLLWSEETGSYIRSLRQDMTRDQRSDSSTVAAIFTGAATNTSRMNWHLKKMIADLTKRGNGIARYVNDPFFFDSIYSPAGREVGEASPPWGVTTMFVAWAEMAAYGKSANRTVTARLQWMLDHTAPNLMPVGEAVDGVTGDHVMSSCPDLYEYAGVYMWTLLAHLGIAKTPNPALW